MTKLVLHNNYVLKIRAEIDRMTNPYSIDLMKDDNHE